VRSGPRSPGRRHPGPGARGFSLIVAIFVILVISALGVFALRVGITQQQTVVFTLLSARAQAAAESGIEYGANRALKAGSCPATTTLNLTATGLVGFVVTVKCTATPHNVGGAACQAYALVSTARRGNYGTVDFVSRSVTRTVTNAPQS
jgi:MSHA biogenesis protein MshP